MFNNYYDPVDAAERHWQQFDNELGAEQLEEWEDVFADYTQAGALTPKEVRKALDDKIENLEGEIARLQGILSDIYGKVALVSLRLEHIWRLAGPPYAKEQEKVE